jgi:2-dehydro-3-deoxyphosphogluconate aldolase/(4S)-4-hydroxy-2-oxoglutarate aldolase
MARFMRLEVINTTLDLGLVPLFYNGETATAIEIASACAKGGARVIEFTNRGEMAYPVFTELARHFEKNDPSIILGVGSVLDAPTAALYMASGANFIVAPSFNPEVAKLCNRRKIAYLPGCMTETEISTAEEYGAEICKIFPGNVGGAEFISAVMAPCPWHRLLPTGGVDSTEESVTQWIKAGAAAVGMGSKLITAQVVKEKKWDDLTNKVAQNLSWVKKARGTPLFIGLEHVGLYPHNAKADEVSAWYEKVFGFKNKEGSSSFMIGNIGAGRVEVVKENDSAPCHLAVRVSNFEEAVAALKAKGVAVKEPNTFKPDVKAAYLQDPDPAGHLVHLLWLAK